MARRTKSQLLPAKLGPIYLIFDHFDLVWWPLMEMARGKKQNKREWNNKEYIYCINKSACFIIHPPLDRNEKKVWTFSDRLTHGQLMEEIKFHPLASRFIFIRSQSYLNYLLKKNFVFVFPIAGWRLQGLHCYRFFEVQHSWERAADLCKRWVPIWFDFFREYFFCYLASSISLGIIFHYGNRQNRFSGNYCVSLTRHPPCTDPSRCSLETFQGPLWFPMLTAPIVVVGSVVKDSPRLRFDYHFESSERGIHLSWFSHLNQLHARLRHFVYFGLFLKHLFPIESNAEPTCFLCLVCGVAELGAAPLNRTLNGHVNKRSEDDVSSPVFS